MEMMCQKSKSIKRLNLAEFVSKVSPRERTLESKRGSGRPEFFTAKLEFLEFKDLLNRSFVFDFNCFYMVTGGELCTTNQLESYSIGDREICFTTQSELTQWNGAMKPKGYFLAFTKDYLLTAVDNKNILRTFENLSECTGLKQRLDAESLDFYMRIFQEISGEVDHPKSHSEEFIRFCVLLMMIRTNRVFQAISDGNRQKRKVPLKSSFYIYRSFTKLLDERFNALMSGGLENRLRVKDFAEELCISPTYLGECIRKTVGSSPKQLIDERTLLLAKCKLLHTSKSVSEIAFDLGFDASGYFIRFFKKYEKLTPMGYRKTTRAMV